MEGDASYSQQFFKSLFLQVLSHALDRIMLGVFCLLLLAASIFFAMMTNGTCIHDGKVITVSEVSRGQETNPFQQEHSDDIR